MFYKSLWTILFTLSAISLSAMEEGNNKDLTNLPSISGAQKIQKRPLSSTPDENQKEAKKPKLDGIESNSDVHQNVSKEEVKKTDTALCILSIKYPGTIKIFASRSKLSIDAPAWILEFLPGLQSMATKGHHDFYTLMPGINIQIVEYLIYVLKGIAQRVTEKSMIDPTDLEVISLIHIFPKTTKNLSIKDMRSAIESLHAKGIIRPFIIGCMDNAQGKPAIIPVLNKNLEEPIANDNIATLQKTLESSLFLNKPLITMQRNFPRIQKFPGNGDWYIYTEKRLNESKNFVFKLINLANNNCYDISDIFGMGQNKDDDISSNEFFSFLIKEIINAAKPVDAIYYPTIYCADDHTLYIVDNELNNFSEISFDANGTYTETNYKFSEFDSFEPNWQHEYLPFLGITEDEEGTGKLEKIFDLRTKQFVKLSKEDALIFKNPQMYISPNGKFFIKNTFNQNNIFEVHVTDLTTENTQAKVFTFDDFTDANTCGVGWQLIRLSQPNEYYILIKIRDAQLNDTSFIIDPSTWSIKKIKSRNIVAIPDTVTFTAYPDQLLSLNKKPCIGSIFEIYPQRFFNIDKNEIEWESSPSPIFKLQEMNGECFIINNPSYICTINNDMVNQSLVCDNLLWCMCALKKLSVEPSSIITMKQWYLFSKICNKNPFEIQYLLPEEEDELQSLFIMLAQSLKLPNDVGIKAYNELKCYMNLFGYNEELVGQRSEKEIETPEQFKQILARLERLNQKALKEMQENKLIII